MHQIPEPTVWVLTDGKAGDEGQCLGVAERLGVVPEIRRVKPRRPWAWLMPRGPIDPGEGPDRPGSPLRPPFPDIAIASGRRAVAYLRALRKASNGTTYTAFLKDPRGISQAQGLRGLTRRISGTTPIRSATPRHWPSSPALPSVRTQTVGSGFWCIAVWACGMRLVSLAAAVYTSPTFLWGSSCVQNSTISTCASCASSRPMGA